MCEVADCRTAYFEASVGKALGLELSLLCQGKLNECACQAIYQVGASSKKQARGLDDSPFWLCDLEVQSRGPDALQSTRASDTYGEESSREPDLKSQRKFSFLTTGTPATGGTRLPNKDWSTGRACCEEHTLKEELSRTVLVVDLSGLACALPSENTAMPLSRAEAAG